MGPWRPQKRWPPWWRQSWQYQAFQFATALGSKPKAASKVTDSTITKTIQFKGYHPIADTAKYR